MKWYLDKIGESIEIVTEDENSYAPYKSDINAFPAFSNWGFTFWEPEG